MPRRFLPAACVVALACLPVGAAPAAGSAPPSTDVTISRPRNNDRVFNTQLQIAGTAPAGARISVSIVDSNPLRTGIVHQIDGRVTGAVTSDADGLWAFTPQTTIVPGDYDLFAAYSTGGQTFQATRVRFVVLNPPAHADASRGWLWKIGLPVLLVLLLVLAAGVFLLRRHTRRVGIETATEALPEPAFRSSGAISVDQDGSRDEAARMRMATSDILGIEQAVAVAAETLERSNREIIVLSHELHDELVNPSPGPAAGGKTPKPKPTRRRH